MFRKSICTNCLLSVCRSSDVVPTIVYFVILPYPLGDAPMKTHQTKCHICQQAAKNQQWDAIFLICLLQCCTAHTFTCSIFLLSIHVRSLFRWSNLYTMTATAVGLGFLNVDPDPRIHLSVIVDPDRRQNEMDPKR